MTSPAIPLLQDLARLVALMTTVAEPAELRRVLRAVTRRARHAGAVVELDGGGAMRVDGVETTPTPPLSGLRAVAVAHGIGRLVVRPQAPARELAQLAGVLARAESSASDPIAELAALQLWHVQLEPGRRAGAAAVALPAEVEPIVARLRAAESAAEVAAGVAELRRWVEGADPSVVPAAQVLARVLLDAIAADPAVDHGRVAALAELLVGIDLRPIVAAALDATPGEGKGEGEGGADALVVLQCVTPAAVPLVLARLAEADTLEMRRRCCDLLLALGSGIDLLVAALDDPRWYLARNAALVLGELQAAEAVRPLARMLGAADARLRVAAAGALARIGNVPALHALCGALGDREVEVRRIAARGVGDATRHGAVVAAATCVAALERETDVDASLELLLALGQIGSAEAIRYLHWTAVGRTRAAAEWELRAAAIGVIVGARSRVAQGARQALLADPDPTVRKLAAELSARAEHSAA